jgi:hypothetical protein
LEFVGRITPPDLGGGVARFHLLNTKRHRAFVHTTYSK